MTMQDFIRKNMVRGHNVFVFFVHNPLGSWVFPCKNRTQEKKLKQLKLKPCFTERIQKTPSLRIWFDRLFNLLSSTYKRLVHFTK